MGEQGGIDFNTTPPTKFTSAINSIETTASISDKNTGELLFYTDGATIWDGSHNVMMNGSSVGQEKSPYSAVQGAVIVPFINDDTKYYLFCIISIGTSSGQLVYSVVDMTLNNGAGAVVPGSKKILLSENQSEAAVAVQGCGMIWLLTQERQTGNFKAFRITTNGVDPNPVVSPLGYSKRPSALVGIKVSPDTKKVVSLGQYFYMVDGSPFLAMQDFNNRTGKVTNGILIDTTGNSVHYGCEFSPNGQRLYVARNDSVFQYDLAQNTPAAIAASKSLVGRSPTNFILQNLQRRSDGSIYVAQYDSRYLDRITNCDALVPGCTLTNNAVEIGGRNTMNLPQMIEYPEEPKPGSTFRRDSTICNDTPLKLTTSYQNATWQDGSFTPTFTATQPGVYWVRGTDADCKLHTDTFFVGELIVKASLINDTILCPGHTITLHANTQRPGTTYMWSNGSAGDSIIVTEPDLYTLMVKYEGCSDTDQIFIQQKNYAYFELGNDTTICNDVVLTLPQKADPLETDKYQWQDGSTNKIFKTEGPGKYYVTVSNECGDISDTIIVTGRNCSLFFPSAFSPNGDNLNDRARLLGDVAGVTDYQLSIYNRWGQQVFTTTNPLEGWNGMQGASLSDIGVYYYYIQYTYKGESEMMKGDLTLIR